MTLRHLVLILGDQLDARSAAFDGFDEKQDAVAMMELWQEATYVPQHKRRLAYFFAAMRHFAEAQRAKGRHVVYSDLDDPENRGDFVQELQRRVAALKPERIILVEPGDWRVKRNLLAAGLPIDMRADRHFLCSREDFAAFAQEHPAMVLETFYRGMRRRLDVLMDADGEPAGGAWNFDTKNREAFGKRGRPLVPAPPRFAPDAITRRALQLVEWHFPGHPGRLDDFALPVTRRQALASLRDFVTQRLPDFGRYQDAMQGGEPLLFHSGLSGPLNLHLLSPRETVDAALASTAPLNAVEGFVRQVIGWREFVHGLYWHAMPAYAQLNALEADLPMPRFYWTGETSMRCLAEAIGHTIDHAYAHHIERLMVLGLFAMLLGVNPYEVHRWHMSMFWDSIDWVSLPNTLGMSQYGDGGVIGTKPYAASGRYIDRMSDHCRHCRYRPDQALGEEACPFTTLYWDFLARHRPRLAANQRMRHQYANLARKPAAELSRIRRQADRLKAEMTADTFLPPA
ncbi:MAG TPA: cryptochrome/photolyase family protein [Roseomonas sp.]|jgi:deoxyribodipyrimidine photolyase-related protein